MEEELAQIYNNLIRIFVSKKNFLENHLIFCSEDICRLMQEDKIYVDVYKKECRKEYDKMTRAVEF